MSTTFKKNKERRFFGCTSKLLWTKRYVWNVGPFFSRFRRLRILYICLGDLHAHLCWSSNACWQYINRSSNGWEINVWVGKNWRPMHTNSTNRHRGYPFTSGETNCSMRIQIVIFFSGLNKSVCNFTFHGIKPQKLALKTLCLVARWN